MRYFFHIGYNGFNYHGWQNLPQTNGENVQYIIETNLAKILKKKFGIVGCGRTDAQVHASQFFFHVDIDKEWDFDLMFRLNKNLPPDIAVFDILAMEGTPHARFDATARTYNYFIHTYKDPYLATISSCYPEKDLDVTEMKRALAILLKYDDFRPFCKNVPVDRSLLCRITKADLYFDETGDKFRIEISANRFLNGMIRIIVNKILMIGRGEMTVAEFENILITKAKPAINRLAYPQGLHLTKVTYPYLDIPSKSAINSFTYFL